MSKGFIGGLTMQLEDYFDFEKFEFEKVGTVERIRVKGTRIAIEHILDPYLRGDSPERIFQGYHHILTLEQVYATITYFLHNRPEVEAYLKRGEEVADFWYQEYLAKEPPEVIKRLRALKAQKQAAQTQP
jgi:uncharacterized protein (DUF433 family)